MKCKIEGCEVDAMYKVQRVCQKHYFRFMRYGTYELTAKPAKYRRSNPVGYQALHEPEHPLCDKSGYVYEHRFVYFNHHKEVSRCALCGGGISWGDCHIDHIDCDVTNNAIENLRPTCSACNTFRGHDSLSMGSGFFTAIGKTLTASAWARLDGVEVSCGTIKNRRASGMSDHDCIFAPRKTHQNTKTKKLTARYDKERGIS